VTLLYFADTRFPIERANGVQTIETCHALARRGHEVTLFVRPDSAAPPRDPLTFYGLPPEPRLHIQTLAGGGGPRGRRGAVPAGRHPHRREPPRCTRVHAGSGAGGVAAAVARATRPRLIYESHGVSMTVAEEMPALLGKPELTASAAKLRRWTGANGGSGPGPRPT